ncbi:AMP-binding protein [Treponema brennaborense]|uniref:Butyrate--CoA ligase n=1 Tax=Treponema brennaborense (strain DSM 12168 / CIP 105900 / DD5/3) TaxID=906968 RepID=F4LKL3_TREBD|nr:AMP-binding protein [Treponema brennaborense]AEE17569.1 Butyrate--CoA ligase [Treponema brennaborense DSM 12168]
MILDRFVAGKSAYSSYEDLKENFSIRIPDNFNFAYDVVDEYARAEPDRRALVWCDDDGNEKFFTFGDLKKASDKTANFLTMNGIRKGDAVMLILRRRYEFWFFILALHKIGAIAVPATHMLLKKDIEYRNNAAGVKMIVSLEEPELQDQVEQALPDSPTVKTLVTVGPARSGWLCFHEAYDSLSETFVRPTGELAAGNEDIMLLYFTSGTSGYPKMVQHDFTYPLGHIVTAKYWQNVVDGGLHLTVAETGWAKAVWGKIYGQWLAGSAVFAYDMLSFVPGKLLEKMARYKVTTFCAPPTVYRYLIKHDLSKYDLSSLTYCTTAGEALNAEVYNRFCEQTGLKMKEGYGQTELTLTIGNFAWMEPKPGSMGKPAPGYEIDIVDAEGKSCAAGETGEIVIRLENGRPFGMFAGYYRDQELTDAAFYGNLYHTGDTAYRDEDGYYWFVGRMDDMIKSAGYRISPFEVESTLLQHPAVLECAVTGVADKKRSQVVKATIVPAPGFSPTQKLAQEIQDFVKHVTAAYKYPRLIEFVKELPKTISGKIRRVEIREKDAQDRTAADENGR